MSRDKNTRSGLGGHVIRHPLSKQVKEFKTNTILKLEDLKKANELNKKIESLRTLIDNTRDQKCEWIEFTYGNGSNKSTVCTDEDTIQLVRDLIFVENLKELESLEEEFFDL